MTVEELLSLRSEIAALRNELHTIKKRQGDQRGDIDLVIKGVDGLQSRVEDLHSQVQAQASALAAVPIIPEVSK